MRLNNATLTVESDLPNASHQATIVANAQAFRILSNNLYSDKISAIIRELCCNAQDAHTLISNTDPIIVTFPTSIDAEFSVTDHGPGLSHEDVLDIYLSYFRSTKGGNNDSIGGLGLGTKSPLAYTDQFTVISRHKHKENVYLIYLNEAGSPQITHIAETDYIGPTGLSVKVGVHSYDQADFRSKGAEILASFTPLPITNLETLTAPQFIYHTPHCAVRETGLGYRRTQVQMGPVVYPVSLTHLSGKYLTDENLLSILPHMRFFAPIGALEIAPSREALSYDPATCHALAQLIRAGVNEVAQLISQDLSCPIGQGNLPQPWDRYCTIHSLHRNLNALLTDVALPVKKAWRLYPALRDIPNLSISHSDSDYIRKTRAKTPRLALDFPTVADLRNDIQFIHTLETPGKIRNHLKNIPHANKTLVFLHCDQALFDSTVRPLIDGAPIKSWETDIRPTLPIAQQTARAYNKSPPPTWMARPDLEKYRIAKEDWVEAVKTLPVLYMSGGQIFLDPAAEYPLNPKEAVLKRALQDYDHLRNAFNPTAPTVTVCACVPIKQASRYPHTPLTVWLFREATKLLELPDTQDALYLKEFLEANPEHPGAKAFTGLAGYTLRKHLTQVQDRYPHLDLAYVLSEFPHTHNRQVKLSGWQQNIPRIVPIKATTRPQKETPAFICVLERVINRYPLLFEAGLEIRSNYNTDVTDTLRHYFELVHATE